MFSQADELLGQSRQIKLRVNAPHPVNLFVSRVDHHGNSTDEGRFLAHVAAGLEQIEFYYEGSFALEIMGGDIWIDTYDSGKFEIESADYESYARMFEREERDPRILEMEQIARHNERVLKAQMAADRAEWKARIEEMRKITEGVMNVAAASNDGNTRAASGSGGASAVPAGASAENSATPDANSDGTGGVANADK